MFCKYERATSIMVIIAQPLDVKAPPVRICYFGTNNKFTAIDVENKIAYVTSELKKNVFPRNPCGGAVHHFSCRSHYFLLFLYLFPIFSTAHA
jgi:hypothetical protein